MQVEDLRIMAPVAAILKHALDELLDDRSGRDVP